MKSNAQTTTSSAVMSEQNAIASARQHLATEYNALQAMSDSLGKSFYDAVNMLFSAQGKVVVTGMGKPGHIGKKIAATLASTGTPAFFVHPGEASHGDLGMIEKQDVVLALSLSGETNELADLLNYVKRFSIPMIAVTGNPNSALAQAATIQIILPKQPEICLEIAPTTSTTMMVAMGDILAAVVLECRGFKKEDFRNFHPGGKLGKILTRIDSLMHKNVQELPLVKEQDKMSEVLVTMTQKGFGCAGVIDAQGDLLGVITDGDLRRHMSADLTQKTAKSIMTENPMTAEPQTLAAEALAMLNNNKRTNMFVLEGKKPVGIIHLHDLLRAGVA